MEVIAKLKPGYHFFGSLCIRYISLIVSALTVGWQEVLLIECIDYFKQQIKLQMFLEVTVGWVCHLLSQLNIITSINVLQIRNCRRSTGGQLADAAAYAPGRRCVSIHHMAALFCMKWRHRPLESVMSNRKSDRVNWCKFTQRTIKFHTDLIWKDKAFVF